MQLLCEALFDMMNSMFSLVYLFIHSVTHVTLDTSIIIYNLQHNLQYMDIHTIQHNK